MAVNPRGLAQANGQLYWTQGIRGDGSTSTERANYRRNLDGTDVTAIHTAQPSLIRDLSFMLRFEPIEVFADGFETGDTSEW